MNDNKTNDPQIRFWNAEQGQKWVTNQQSLDTCFARVNERLIDIASPRAGDAVLDIGCGCGATSLSLADRIGSEGRITAVDVSRPLLEHAQSRLNAAGIRNIALVEGDAQVYPFPEADFDQAVSRFGSMFFIDPAAAFRNIAHAIREGGKITLAAWASVEENPWFAIPRNAVIELLGKPEPVDPRSPGPMAFADLSYLEQVLHEAGLEEFEVRNEDNNIVTVFSDEEMASLACNLGPAVRQMNEMGATPEQRQKAEETVRLEFEQFHQGGTYTIPVRLVIAEIRV